MSPTPEVGDEFLDQPAVVLPSPWSDVSALVQPQRRILLEPDSPELRIDAVTPSDRREVQTSQSPWWRRWFRQCDGGPRAGGSGLIAATRQLPHVPNAGEPTSSHRTQCINSTHVPNLTVRSTPATTDE